MTSRINYNMVSQKTNPYLTKITFYTKKHNALIFHENLELFNYFKKLLRFYKLKKNLPSYGLKIKRSSLNNIYFFTIFEGDSLTNENLFKTFLKFKKTLKKRKIFHKILTKKLKKKFINQHYKKKTLKFNLLLKKKKNSILSYIVKKIPLKKLRKIKGLKTLMNKRNFFKKINKFDKLQKKNKQTLKSNTKRFLLNSSNKSTKIINKKKIKIYRKKRLIFNQFLKLKHFFFKAIKKSFNSILLTKKNINFNKFENQQLNKLIKNINFNKILKFDHLVQILNKIQKSKKLKINKQSQFNIYKSKKLKQFNYALNNKSKSKFIKKSNKYLSIPKSLEFNSILKNLLLSNILLKTNARNNFIKSLKNFSKIKKIKKIFNIILSQNKNSNKMQSKILFFNFKLLNNFHIKNYNFNKIFCYKLLIEKRLNFFNKIHLFENELKFTFKIKFSELKIIYQRIFDLNDKIMNKLNIILPFSDIPEQYEYSRLKILLKEGLKTQNFTKFETVLKRTIRRQHSKRLLEFSKDIIILFKTIFYEIYLKNIYIFSQYNNLNKNVKLSNSLIKLPYNSPKKIPFSISFQYKGKLKKDGRKQRFSFFLKNPYYLDLLKLYEIQINKLKYERTASQFFAHFKRGGVGGFKLLVNYIYV